MFLKINEKYDGTVAKIYYDDNGANYLINNSDTLAAVMNQFKGKCGKSKVEGNLIVELKQMDDVTLVDENKLLQCIECGHQCFVKEAYQSSCPKCHKKMIEMTI